MGLFDFIPIIGPAISGLLGGAGTAAGSLISADAAGKAAEIQAGSADRATQAQLDMYYKSREDLAPWREAGGQAIGNLNALMQQGPGQFQESPGYQFTLGEGLKATERGAAGRTGLLSGPTQKAMTRYATGLASNEYDNFLRRYYEKLTPYQSMAGIGQSSAANTAAMGSNTGAGIANNAMMGGYAGAQGQLAKGDAWAGGAIGMANIGQNMLNNYLGHLKSQNSSGSTAAPGYGFNFLGGYPAAYQSGWNT